MMYNYLQYLAINSKLDLIYYSKSSITHAVYQLHVFKFNINWGTILYKQINNFITHSAHRFYIDYTYCSVYTLFTTKNNTKQCNTRL